MMELTVWRKFAQWNYSESGLRPFEDPEPSTADPKVEKLMEKRLGVIAILLTKNESVQAMNLLLSHFADMILARMGLPLRYKGVNVISLVVEASTDRIGALTGKLGRIDGCKVKSVLTEFHKESIDGGDCTGSEQE